MLQMGAGHFIYIPAVLFIGASQTQVFDVPQIVEVLSESAPAGSPPSSGSRRKKM